MSESARDIDDPSHYSIEEAKQKAEHDRKMKQEKKQEVRVGHIAEEGLLPAEEESRRTPRSTAAKGR